MHCTWVVLYFFMVGIRALIRPRWSGSLLAACIGCLLAFQAMVASVGLGMSTSSPLGQPVFDTCGASATNDLDASTHDNGTDPSGRPLRCPFCFVAAQCAAYPTIAGEVKAFPAFAGRGVAAASYASVPMMGFTARWVTRVPRLHSPSDACDRGSIVVEPQILRFRRTLCALYCTLSRQLR
jgi:hypothetical protein